MTDTIRTPIDTAAAEPRRLWFAPALAVPAGAVLWLAAAPVAGAHLFVETGASTTEVGPTSVVLGSAVGTIGAIALGWAARRWSARPRRHFVLTAVTLLALSLISPATAATTTSTALWLGSMHVAVGAVAIPVVAAGLPRGGASREAQE